MKVKAKALTIVEVIVVVAILLLLLGLLLSMFGHSCGGRGAHPRSISGANLRGIFQSMYTYSVTQKDMFPIAGEFAEGDMTGFKAGSLRGQKDLKPSNPYLINNGTASLWLMVRDGSINSKSFINPSASDQKDEQKDIKSSRPVALSETWDFLGAKDNGGRKTLSYSFINMYHSRRSRNWSANVSSNWVVMGDNNNADASTKDKAKGNIHSMTKQESNMERDIEGLENSTNHDQAGQNFLFGDGHVEFNNNPFVGPGSDNVYAQNTSTADPASATYTENPAPPTLGTTDPWTQPQRDVMLIPLTGNNGVNLSENGR